METFRCSSASFAASRPLICTELHFDDVFGGPPRRFSAREGRFNFHSDVGEMADDRFGRRRRSASIIQKPSVDFFDDIFRSNDFYFSRSASTYSSLLVELGKGMKVPAWNSVSRNPGTPSPAAPSSRLSRHTSQSQRVQTTEEELCDGKTPLYVEFSLTSDGSVKILKNVINDEEDNTKQKSSIRPSDNYVQKFLNNSNGNLDMDIKLKEPSESNQSDVNKTSVPTNHGWTNGRKIVNEKVKELVAMFNQNSSSNSKMLAETLSQSSDGNDRRPPTAVKKIQPEKTCQIDDVSRNGDSGKDSSTLFHKDTSGSVSGSYCDGNESLSDPLDEFEVKELTQEQNAVSQTDEYQLGIQFLCMLSKNKAQKALQEESDAKIRKWSSGKEGNIRSLLSTMQHVLWPESGWKPVALVDIIETNQVKKIYQRALLCVHPDKLQQKGVTEHQRYIAQQVFDILQESWSHFSSLTSL